MPHPAEKDLISAWIEKLKLQPGEGVDLGCGRIEKLEKNDDEQICPEILIGVDRALAHRPDICADVLDMSFFVDERFRFVYAGHLLEDMHKPEKALREWLRILAIGGTMIIVCPDMDYYPLVGTKGKELDGHWVETNPGHQFNVSVDVLISMVKETFDSAFRIIEARTLNNHWSVVLIGERKK